MSPFDKQEDPMDALSALTARVREALTPLGVSVEQFWFAASPGDGPHMAQGVFLVDRDAAFKSAEEKAFDEQFKEIAIREQLDKEQEKVQEARDGLADTLRSLTDGFLPEEEDRDENNEDR